MKKKKEDDIQIKHPHDRLIRNTLSKKENAINFFENYLPDELIEILDTESITDTKDTFIDSKLKGYYSDILYDVKLKNRPAYVYILFEHKQKMEYLTPLQLLKYMVRIWEKELKTDKKRRKLTPIIGYVFYHGKEDWKIGNSFRELFNYPHEIEKYLLDFEYVLNNIYPLPDHQLKGNPEVWSTVYLMKHITDQELLEIVQYLINRCSDFFNKHKESKDFLESMIVYICSARKIKLEELVEAFNNSDLNEGGDQVMTTAQVLIKKGKQEGIREGKREEKQQVLIRLLSRKYGLNEPEKEMIKTVKDLDSLDLALDQILFAESKDEVFKSLK